MGGAVQPALRAFRLAFRAAGILLLILPFAANAATLKVATWNLNWLTTRSTGDPDLPDDVKTRAPEDFDRLAAYARELNADIVALEEVDGFSAATKLFPKDAYSLHFTHDHVIQRVGLAVRRGLHYDVNPDLKALSAHHLRSGADITLHLPDGDLRILAVHLKKGCREEPLASPRTRSCSELAAQIAPLTEWIAARKADNEPFLILGDFNRWMDNHDAFVSALTKDAKLVRATDGQRSPCWGGERFIDHIFAGGPATAWLQPQTLHVLVYQETGKEWQDKLSDHCPVSVDMNVPN
jgi:endonuclease/exonuclease/phosphatase family metal-dependent hydrolase